MLDFFCRPKSYAKNVYCIDVNGLVRDGYKCLLCDIDNTLVAFHEIHPTKEAMGFFKRCENVGLKVVLCSNNTQERVGTFADYAGLDYIHFFCKPFKPNYKKLLKKTGFNRTEIAVTGDQILTDIVGGNRMKFHTIFLDPLVDYDSKHTGFSRFMEKYVLTYLTWRKRFKRGEYYGYKM